MRHASWIPWKRHVFIDGGGHNGSSVRKFRRDYDRRTRFEIFSFEPNPQFASCYAGLPRHRLLPFAVWTHDGEAAFYLDREDGDGSTLFREKLTRENGGFGALDKSSPVAVRTIDLSEWIRRSFRTADYIILKLDVEGAEYRVLDKMLNDGTIGLIDHLFVEWHWDRIGVPESDHRRLVDRLNGLDIPITEWDAQ